MKRFRTCSQLLIFCFVLSCTLLLGQISEAKAPARAQWVDNSRIVLRLPQGFRVHQNLVFSLGERISLHQQDSILLPVIRTDYSHVELSTQHLSSTQIDQLIRRPLRLFVSNKNGQVLDSTALQYSGILDQMYFYNGNDLGAHVRSTSVGVKLWAPTARNVELLLYKEAQDTHPAAVVPMKRQHSVWFADLPGKYVNYFYLYQVEVYQPLTDQVESHTVTDPYSFSLTADGAKSQIVNLQDPALKPQGWDRLQKPSLRSFNDIVIYELHIRDFSVADFTVPFPYRGGYEAFAQTNTDSSKYLQSLADAGMTHVHLLPFNDFGSVPENKDSWENYESESSDLQEAQAYLGRIKAKDPFNWGYDPVHFMTPEGSYATDPNGSRRVYETRNMVQALNKMNLRVIQDVVFNHTFEAGLEPYSVFDKIVPLYYYRVNDEGDIQKSSCCNDTASEHRMMEKLMIDSVLHWARTYKIDAFRFDLMSFHSRSTMEKIKSELRGLTEQEDGIDGSKIYLYGEGWAFGSFYDRYPSESLHMLNSYGSGYGFFNDRLRDAVRGGTTNSAEKSDQGFATGLYFDFNKEPANRNTPPDSNGQREKILHLGDVIKAGLAGNLRDFRFKEHWGSFVTAGQLHYRGAPTGTSAEALETVSYVSAHDGYTLWDAVQAKAPFYTSGRFPSLSKSEDRQRMHQLALALPMLSQGIPFIESGSELLRSKNGDQDSYNSGDFFNRIDWSRQQNFWGAGLPPAWKNIDDWSFWQPRLQEPGMKVTPELITRTEKYFKALLRVRQSSDLFKLNDLSEIQRSLTFIDNDKQAEPGLIAMHLQSSSEKLLIFFNAAREARSFEHGILGQNWELHPLLDEKVDTILSQVLLIPGDKRIQIPGRSTVILIQKAGH